MDKSMTSGATTSEASNLNVETWTVDGERSTLTFSLRHLVISEIRGQFRSWGGELQLDRKNASRSRVRIWVDTNSLDTGEPERDAHVRSAEFLDVAKYPRAEFRSAAIGVNADGSARLEGLLRIRRVTGAVELAIEDRGTRTESGRARRIFVARGKLDRQAFGLHWNQDLDVGGVVVGDQINLEARVELLRNV
jgi:polyisoprenoid-binding protein YceI